MDLVIKFTFEKYKILPTISTIVVALLAIYLADIKEFIKNILFFKISISLLVILIPFSIFFFLKSFKFEEEDMITKFNNIMNPNTQNQNQNQCSMGCWKWIVLNSPKIVLSIFTLAIILLVASFFVEGNKQWMLSLYGSGTTIMRIDYPTKETCISAGRSYLVDKSAERFDCGYECSSFEKINLQDSPICEKVCNEAGCR